VKLNIRTKLLFGYLPVIILMSATLVVWYLGIKSIEQVSDRLLHEQVPIADHAMELMVQVRNEQQLFTDLSLSGNEAIKVEIETVREDIAAELAALDSLMEGEQRDLLDRIKNDERTLAAAGFEMAKVYLSEGREPRPGWIPSTRHLASW
jgi:CHASE3 domain sensor protein